MRQTDLRPHLGWRWKTLWIGRARKEVKGQKGYWEPLPLIYARNGFNKLSRLAMMWTVRHLWPAGVRFVFN